MRQIEVNELPGRGKKSMGRNSIAIRCTNWNLNIAAINLNMSDFELIKDNTFDEDTISETKPRMCGWLLLKMAEDKKQLQQNKLPESLEKDYLD